MAAIPQQGSAKETASTRSGTLEGSGGALPQVGEIVQVFSRTFGTWLDAEVESYEMGAVVKLVLRYTIPGVGLVQKRVARGSVNLRIVDRPQPKANAGAGSMAATGWAEVEDAEEGHEEEAALQEDEEEEDEEDDEEGEEDEDDGEEGEEEEEEDDQEVEAPRPAEELQLEERVEKRASSRRTSSKGGEAQQQLAKEAAEALRLESGVRQPSSRRMPSKGDEEAEEREAEEAHADDTVPQELLEGETIAGGRFRLHHVIGAGSFSEVRLATRLLRGAEGDERQLALKLEGVDSKYPQLLDEAKRYRLLAGGAGIPQLFWHGTSRGYNIMALELLGPSLEDMYNRCERHFSLETVVRLAEQMLSCVEFIHSRGLIHRDLKPNNFCLGHTKERRAVVHCVDFGLAKRYTSGREHIPFRTGLPFVGTVRYASLGAQLGNEQGRRDDLQALGYIFLYHLNGTLPWQGVTAANKKERRDLVLSMKQSISVEDLCRGAPQEFEHFLQYCCDELEFDSDPDYKYLAGLVQQVLSEPASPSTACSDAGRRASLGSSAQALEELFDTVSSHQ